MSKETSNQKSNEMGEKWDAGLECKGTYCNGSGQSFLNNLEWRRSVKHFGNTPIDTTAIKHAIVNAPSSFGLQPYKIIAVRNSKLKEKLCRASYNQPQVTECDTLFVFCARTDVESCVEEYVRHTGLEEMRTTMMGYLSHMPNKIAWASKQAYIALGFGLAACAELKIQSCPMEGFTASEVHKILGLSDNLVPVVFLAVGSPAENDGTWPRFRFPAVDLIQERD